jgi:hypothetical protein
MVHGQILVAAPQTRDYLLTVVASLHETSILLRRLNIGNGRL